MRTRLIETEDGMLIQITEDESGPKPVSKKDKKPEKVEEKYERITELIKKATKPISDSLANIKDDLKIKEANIEFYFGIGAEAKFFLAGSSIDSHIKVNLKISPKS